MCIYLWMQSDINNPEEDLYDQNGKRISYDDTNRQNIVEKIFSVSKNGKEIVIDHDSKFKQSGNSFVFEFYTNIKDEYNRRLPALLYFTTSYSSISSVTSKIQDMCDNIDIELDCVFIIKSLMALKKKLLSNRILLCSLISILVILVLVFIKDVWSE